MFLFSRERENVKCMEENPLAGGGSGVVLGFIFLFFSAAGLSEPQPHYSPFCGQF